MSLRAVSAIDGRYATLTAPLSAFFSEYALIRFRVRVEIEWLILLSDRPEITDVRPLTPEERIQLRRCVTEFSEEDALLVKEIERTTNHDVKAVEYFLKRRLDGTSLDDVREWLHFACTSEDINNLAHALMLKGAIEEVFLPQADRLVADVAALASETADVPMLSHTHGQPASPTTVGKELAVFVTRWRRQIARLRTQEYLGKMNGAVGNFNAHLSAYPDAPWPDIAERFVTGFGLTYNPLTTQIEPHDYMAELFHNLVRWNNILLDFDRDLWGYIHLKYFRQKAVAGEIGSSTMPHKVNPIDFENSEANIGLSNAILEHLASKLTVSRWQRDLSDSSAIRSVGTGIAYACIAVGATLRGLRKLSVNGAALTADLEDAWEVLAEPVQTVLRKAGISDAYEKLKDLTRGSGIDAVGMHAFIADLNLPEEDKERLLRMTPAAYIGLAPELARRALAGEE
ncbi:MAG: adenylosuccinate lyase [Capsulimonadales bacterium]|nr:adenylosuccinate lyase [Capsulimonadales bacterium]